MSPSDLLDSDKDYNTDISPCGPQYGGDGCSPDDKAILRNRIVDNFVNESYFQDVHLSPTVTSELLNVGHWVTRLVSISMSIGTILLFYICCVFVLAFVGLITC